MKDVRYVATAPVQGDGERQPGTILWREHMTAYEEYKRRHGTRQTADEIAFRGGWGFDELTALLGHEPETWEPRR